MRYLLLISLFLAYSCQHEKEATLALIPFPDQLESNNNYSKIQELRFHKNANIEMYKPWFAELSLPIKTSSSNPNVSINVNKELSQMTYILHVNKSDIKIEVSEERDVRNAIVSLIQIWEINNRKLVECKIKDQAEFDYRGMHLDVARHFFPVSDIKKYIDYLTFYKYNKFHWHLTEDQGWRIEIKKYPKLQEIAAFRNETLIGHYNDQPQKYDGKRYGGFYSQEEIKEVVAYAGARGIDVIPEIEMPGHSQAALAAYPELGCENKKVEVATKWGVFPDVYCPTETTFEFLENVLDEVTALFPYEYLHIGGDECPKDAWKKSSFCQSLIKENGLKDEQGLQSYFIRRMANYLKTKNKTIIGWDEILEGGLNEGSIVMSWRGTEGGVAAAKEGHKVIMTPGSHCYFDHYQSPSSSEPVAIGGLTTVKDVYGYEVIPSELSKKESNFVWGAQGNVWTEYMPKFEKVEYMALARMTALSEVLHNNLDTRDYKKYQKRLAAHTRFWKKQLINIADHQLDVQIEASTKIGEGSIVNLESDYPNAEFFCILPNNEIVPAKDGKHLFTESGSYEFYCQSGELIGSREAINYVHHLATKANIKLKDSASEAYPGSGPSAVINGIIGSSKKYGGPEWLGFTGKDFDAIIELPSSQKITEISCRFFNGEGQWIYIPSEIEIEISKDGQNFTSIAKKEAHSKPEKINTVVIKLDVEAKFVRVIAKNHGIIGEGKQGAGHKAWLFVDEIIIN